MEKRLRHIPALDGVRGLAVLAVICAHANATSGGILVPGVVNQILARILGGGWIGVDLFFVLSGFLITGILLESRSSPRYFLNFYARRSLRIFPLYFGFLSLTLLGYQALLLSGAAGSSVWTAAVKYLANPAEVVISLYTYCYNIYSALAQQQSGAFHHFWSLCVEEHFYLVWPALILLYPAHVGRICTVGALASLLARIVVIIWGTNVQQAYLLTPCRLDGLLLGGCVATLTRIPSIRHYAVKAAKQVAAVSASMFVLVIAYTGHFYDFVDHRLPGIELKGSGLVLTAGISVVSTMFASLLYLVAEGYGRRILQVRPLVFWGKHSYGMYVFHPLILRGIDKVMVGGLEPLGWKRKILVAVATVAISSIVAYVSFQLFEKPFLALKRRFESVDKKAVSV